MDTAHKASRTKSSARRPLLMHWQEAALKHPVLIHFAAAGILFCIIDYGLFYVIDPGAPLLEQIILEVSIAVMSLIIPLSITYWSLRNEIGGLLRRATTLGPAQAINVAIRLISQEVKALIKDLEDLKGYGETVETEKVPQWVEKRCWRTMNGRYIGTSSHLPSTYMDILGGYLESHQIYLRRTGVTDSVRIVFCDVEALKEDWNKNRAQYQEFVDWHKDNNVELLLFPPKLAKRLAGNYTPRKATDMGCWDGELILVWHYGEDPGIDPVQLQLTFLGEEDYENCRDFCERAMTDKQTLPFPAEFNETFWGF